MPEPGGAVSSLEEFWNGLEARGVEPDLFDSLKARADQAARPVERVGDHGLVIAVASCLLPGAVPAVSLAAFVDEDFDAQLGRGDERIGVMPRGELIPVGFRVLDEEARRRGSPFVDLPDTERERLLLDAEAGRPPPLNPHLLQCGAPHPRPSRINPRSRGRPGGSRTSMAVSGRSETCVT